MSMLDGLVAGLPVGAASVCIPLWACVVGPTPQGWTRVGSLVVTRQGVEATFFNGNAVWAPAWEVVAGVSPALGEAKNEAVFAVERAGGRVELGRAWLTAWVTARSATMVAKSQGPVRRFFRGEGDAGKGRGRDRF